MPGKIQSVATRRSLIITLVALQFVTVALILLVSRVSNENVLLKQASLILEKTAQESLIHAQGYLRPAKRIALTTSNLFSQNIFKNNDEAIEQYFLAQLQEHLEFTGIYIAGLQGDFHYVSRNRDRPNTTYRIKKIDHSSGEKRTVLRWLDGYLNPVGIPEAIQDDYDPLSRPWYKAALKANKLIWTEPYIFFTSKKPGITLSIPVYNGTEIKGILGVDIELADLSEFLSTLNLGESGSALIMNKQQRFIAISGDQLDRDDMLNATELHFKQKSQQMLAEKAVAIFFNEYDAQGKARGVKFNFGNTRYLAAFVPFKVNAEGPEWILVTYAPEHTFLKKIRQTEKTNISIAVCILLLSISIGWVLATRTWKPVEGWLDQAITDQLTGLYNRHHLFAIGKRLYDRVRRSTNENLSLALIDLDNFKSINDRYGHNVGDEVLKNIGWRIQSELRPEDIVARFGGEEFIALFPNTEIDKAVMVVERLQKTLRTDPVQSRKGTISVTLSAGISSTEHVKQDLSFVGFIELADKALYQAKNSGKDKVEIA